MKVKTRINAALCSLRRFVRRFLCRHALAWVRNIHGDEINLTGCRTIWICEKCCKVVYDRDYITREMACVIHSPNGSYAENQSRIEQEPEKAWDFRSNIPLPEPVAKSLDQARHYAEQTKNVSMGSYAEGANKRTVL